jgi:hypothetical protein
MILFENYELTVPSNLAFAASYKGLYITTAADVLEACRLATGDNELADAVKAVLQTQQQAIADKDNEIKAGEQEVQASYANAERFAACLHEVQAALEELADDVSTCKRLNKSQLVKTLQQLIITIDNEL